MISNSTGLLRRHGLVSFRNPKRHWRPYSDAAPAKKSGHSQWYADIVPAMIPIFLLGSAVYLGLQLTQLKLSHEKFMGEAAERVRALEAEVDALRQQRENNIETVTPPSSAAVNPSATKKSGWW